MAAIPVLTFPDSAYVAYLSGDIGYHTPADIYFVNQDNKPLKHLAYRDILLRDAINDVIQMINAGFTGSTLIATSEAGHSSVRATLELMLSQALNADGTMKQSAIVAAVSASGILHAPVSIHPASSMLLQLTSATDQMLAWAHEWDAVISATPYRGSHTSVCQALIDGCRRILMLDEIVNDRVFNGTGTGVVITNGNIVITNSAATKLYIVGVGTSDSVWQFNSLKIDNTGTFYGDPIKFENFTFNFESNTTPANPLIDIQCKSIQFHNIIFAHDVRTAAATTHLCKIESGNANGFVSFVNFLEDPAGTADKTNYTFFQMPNGSITDYMKFEKVAVFNFGDFDVTVNTVEFEGVYTDTLNAGNSVELKWRGVNTTLHVVDSRIAIDTDIYFYYGGILYVENLNCVGPTIDETYLRIYKDGASAGNVYVDVDGLFISGNFGIQGHTNYYIEYDIESLRLMTAAGAAAAATFSEEYCKNSSLENVVIDDSGASYTHTSPSIYIENSQRVIVGRTVNQYDILDVGNYPVGVISLDNSSDISVYECSIGSARQYIIYTDSCTKVKFYDNDFYFSKDNTVYVASHTDTWLYFNATTDVRIQHNDVYFIDVTGVLPVWIQDLVGFRYDAGNLRSIEILHNHIFVPSAVTGGASTTNINLVTDMFQGVAVYPSTVFDILIEGNEVHSDSSTYVYLRFGGFPNVPTVKHVRFINNSLFYDLQFNNNNTLIDDFVFNYNVVGYNTMLRATSAELFNIEVTGNKGPDRDAAAGGVWYSVVNGTARNITVSDNYNPVVIFEDCNLYAVTVSNNYSDTSGNPTNLFIYRHTSASASITAYGISISGNIITAASQTSITAGAIVIYKQVSGGSWNIYGIQITNNAFHFRDTSSSNYAICIGTAGGYNINAHASISLMHNQLTVPSSGSHYLVYSPGGSALASDTTRLGVLHDNMARFGVIVTGNYYSVTRGWVWKVHGIDWQTTLANFPGSDNLSNTSNILVI